MSIKHLLVLLIFVASLMLPAATCVTCDKSGTAGATCVCLAGQNPVSYVDQNGCYRCKCEPGGGKLWE